MRALIERLLLTAITTAFVLAFNTYWNKPNWRHYVGLCIAAGVLYFLLVPLSLKVKKYAQTIIRKFFPKIGVLNGYTQGDPLREYKCIPVNAGVPSEGWLNALRGAESLKSYRFRRIHSISASQIDTSYKIVINPFGENFPEEDIDLHTTFNRIRSYVNSEGIFVNSAAAFYHNQNTASNEMHRNYRSSCQSGWCYCSDSGSNASLQQVRCLHLDGYLGPFQAILR